MGAKVWGAIAEVGLRELIVSLPHGLKGHVPVAEVGPLPTVLHPAASCCIAACSACTIGVASCDSG